MKRFKVLYLIKIFIVTSYYLLVTLPLIVSAAQVSLEWDPNADAPDGYRVYYRQYGQAYDYSTYAWSGTNTNCTIAELEEGVTYYFVVRAFVEGDESGDSNEVSYTTSGASTTISDSDGDGMPDSWELQYGLDPDTDDAAADMDSDGISNIEEYANDSPPNNSSPVKPLLSSPSDGSVNVLLTTTLETLAYEDPENDAHIKTRYQVSLSSDFSSLVYDKEFEEHLTSLPVAELILDPDTTYYWRVKYYDAFNGQSEWADPFSFVTVDYETAGDFDGDGIIDDQAISSHLDLDSDGTADAIQSGMQGVDTLDSLISAISVKTATAGVVMGGVRAISIDDIPQLGSQPENVSSLISFKLYLPDGTTTASVVVYFSTAAPQNASWYKYDVEQGWAEYPNAVFSSDRKSVTLVLEDGGTGDQDGVQNGVIVDPAALGYSTETSDRTEYLSEGEEGGASGCFIGSFFNY